MKFNYLLFFVFFMSCSAAGKEVRAGRDSNPKGNIFTEAIEDLYSQARAKGFEKLKIGLGKFVYGDSEMSGSFVPYIKSELSLALAKNPGFEEISRSNLKEILKEQELAMTGLTDTAGAIDAGPGIKGIDVFLSGSYQEEGEEVRVNLSLVGVRTAGKIAVGVLRLRQESFPEGLTLKPDNFASTKENLLALEENKGAAKGFNIRVWSDKGESPVYEEDEKMRIFFRTNKNCHLRLYYTSADNEIQLIFPNQYEKNDFIQANKVYSIPDEDSVFDFTVSEPFGAEIIKAVASLQPFKDKDFVNSEEVFKSYGKATKTNISGLMSRGIKVGPVQARTEATFVLTTVRKK